jgi:peroxiredoxin
MENGAEMNRIEKLATLALAVLLVPAAGMAIYAAGDTVADFTLPDVHGELHSLYDNLGEIVVLNFFTTWCPGCNEEAEALEHQIWLTYREQGLTVVSVNLAQPPILVDGWAQAMGVTYRILVDDDDYWGLYGLFGGQQIPYNAVLDRQMTLRYSQIGFDLLAITDIIETVLAEDDSPTVEGTWSGIKALYAPGP